ncbi:peptidyl-glycine alpha-amidating monooxygenase A-like isoform X2 [Acropora palmata]|uniref:peptidyl-glycine alpha-amidating monooxygenase A-like isoform X2 n=1 Tax=Acropora palmata TaxID=6131 RepID=UPI003DA0AF61
MTRELAIVFSLFLSVITNSFGDFQDQMRSYHDTLYQRSWQHSSEESKDVNLRMPGVHPIKNDSYLCTAVNLGKRKQYIVGFKPFAEMHTAHHMLLFGCQVPADMAFSRDGKFWNCGDMGKGVCGNQGAGEKIIYAWGRNAPDLKLPKDVAFEVGGDSGIAYLVLQVHYGKVDQFVANPSLKDNSGVDLKTSFAPPRKLAAIHLLASGGYIPQKAKAWHLDTGCQYGNGPILHPFAFRVHAHTLGTVISGYRVRNGVWTLIGKGDPQRPQAFYPVKPDKEVDIKAGDTLAARCTFNSMQRDKITYIGATMADEMCNFYMMYWYEPNQNNMETGIPESACLYVDEARLMFPLDSDIPLPGSGVKMEMKRDFAEGCGPYCNDDGPSLLLEEDKRWPGNQPIDHKLGQVTAVDIDKYGNVVIFHRGSRRWEIDSFDANEVFSNQKESIPEATVLTLDSKTGKIMNSWGQNMFFMPHGLTIDSEGNTWLTDVAMHQVFKFPPGRTESSLTLGVRFQPGSDIEHFCKPTDVAVDSSGFFYVSDGYCNSRVLKFSPDGKQKVVLISNAHLQHIVPSFFQIPHSLSLDERNKRLFVADRENSRVLMFDADKGRILQDFNYFGERVFAAHYHREKGGILHVVNGPISVNSQGFTFSLRRNAVIQEWRPASGFSEPHDVTSDDENGAVYVADIGKNTVWKFKRRGQIQA